jgi:mannose-6-phosphate isomerase-like protein (cupin superfamily)
MAKRYRMLSLGKPERVKGWNALSRPLRVNSMGLTMASFPAGHGYDHPHSHAVQEEVYLLIAGKGEVGIDGKIIAMKPGDMIAVEPQARRALRSATRTPSTWLMIGAVPGSYRQDDWTEYEDPSFPVRRLKRANGTRAARNGAGANGRALNGHALNGHRHEAKTK